MRKRYWVVHSAWQFSVDTRVQAIAAAKREIAAGHRDVCVLHGETPWSGDARLVWRK